MRWTLLLLMMGSHSLAGPPLFRLTQWSPSENSGSFATDSPCEGFPATGVTAWTLANRSLESLPSCLPRTLRSLDGSHNLLRALSARDLGHLPALQELTLSHNLIATLRWGPGAPAALRTLDLTSNLLAAGPTCTEPAPGGLRTLLLAGNPLQELRPRAFACFPELQLLNLSGSALHRGIAGAAFTGADGRPLAALEVLDLSGTHLERVESGWIRDLPNLKSLYLRKMPRLRTLEGDIFKMTPNLQQLDCQDSPALASVHTHIFEDTPCLQVLLFQNCNLSSFQPWTVNSSQVLFVNLFGNPLTCSCELAWLLVDPNKTVLHRAADTMCRRAAGSEDPFPGPLSLSELSEVCSSDQSTTLPASNPPSLNRMAYAPGTQGPSPGHSTTPATRPGGGHQRVTKAPSHTVASLTRGVWTHSDALDAMSLSSTDSLEGHSPSGAPPKVARTTETDVHKHTATTALRPSISTAFTSLDNKHPDPSLASTNAVNVSQPNWRTQSIHEAVHTSPLESEMPIILLDDSEEDEETQKSVGTPHQQVDCDYHPCRHLQTPCEELQRHLHCNCPGLSRGNVIPDPPKLQKVAEVTDTTMLIHWCAPNSVVLWYQIDYSVAGESGNQSVIGNIYSTTRQYPLYGLKPGTSYHVCVRAVNAVGVSQLRTSHWERSCDTFTTKPSSMIIFWALCTSSGLLLSTTLVLSVCLCRRRWRSHRQCYDTHLVTFKNPATAECAVQR